MSCSGVPVSLFILTWSFWKLLEFSVSWPVVEFVVFEGFLISVVGVFYAV